MTNETVTTTKKTRPYNKKRKYTKRAFKNTTPVINGTPSANALDAIHFLAVLTETERTKVISLFN